MSILDYPTAGTLGENDFFYVVQNGLDRKVTFKQMPVVTNTSNGLCSYPFFRAGIFEKGIIGNYIPNNLQSGSYIEEFCEYRDTG